jgi:hypothetical protein
VQQRVGARVAVVGGIGQRADAAGVEHDHEGSPAQSSPSQ